MRMWLMISDVRRGICSVWRGMIGPRKDLLDVLLAGAIEI
jgi:hypothetical protein